MKSLSLVILLVVVAILPAAERTSKYKDILFLAPYSGLEDMQWGQGCPGGICPPPGGGVGQPPSYPQQQMPANVPQEIVNASVQIKYSSNNSKRWMGSGTVYAISSNVAYVVTNKHVCPEAGQSIQVFTSDQRAYSATFVAADQSSDLAVVIISSSGISNYVPVQTSPPQTSGEKVWQVGYPLGRGPNKRQGTTRGLDGFSMVDSWHQQVFSIYMSCQQGDSGSGIFSQNTKQLIAVLWGGDMRSVTCSVPWVDVSRFTQACFKQQPMAPRQPQQPTQPIQVPILPPVQQQPAIPAPVVPVQPPSLPQQPSVDLSGIQKDLADIKGTLTDHGSKLTDLTNKISTLEKNPPVDPTLAGQVKSNTQKIADVNSTLPTVADQAATATKTANAAKGAAQTATDTATSAKSVAQTATDTATAAHKTATTAVGTATDASAKATTATSAVSTTQSALTDALTKLNAVDAVVQKLNPNMVLLSTILGALGIGAGGSGIAIGLVALLRKLSTTIIHTTPPSGPTGGSGLPIDPATLVQNIIAGLQASHVTQATVPPAKGAAQPTLVINQPGQTQQQLIPIPQTDLTRQAYQQAAALMARSAPGLTGTFNNLEGAVNQILSGWNQQQAA